MSGKVPEMGLPSAPFLTNFHAITKVSASALLPCSADNHEDLDDAAALQMYEAALQTRAGCVAGSSKALLDLDLPTCAQHFS